MLVAVVTEDAVLADKTRQRRLTAREDTSIVAAAQARGVNNRRTHRSRLTPGRARPKSRERVDPETTKKVKKMLSKRRKQKLSNSAKTASKSSVEKSARALTSSTEQSAAGIHGRKTTRLDRDDGVSEDRMRRSCMDRLESAAAKGFDQLQQRHVLDVESLMDRVEFSLADERDESTPQGAGGRGGEICSTIGLPIRERVSRSGQVCVARDAGEAEVAKGEIADDGLIELMYHYGR